MKREYNSRPSVYAGIYNAISKKYQEGGFVPMKESDIETLVKCTPGMMLADGVSIKDALKTLKSWKLLAILNPVGLKGERIIPLKWDK